MGTAVCRGESERSTYFDKLATGVLYQNFSEESFLFSDSGELKSKSGSRDDLFLNKIKSTRRFPKSEGRLLVHKFTDRDEHKAYHEKTVYSLKQRIQMEGTRRETEIVSALEKRRNMQLSCVTQLAEAAIQRGNIIMDDIETQRSSARKSKDFMIKTENESEIQGITGSPVKLQDQDSNTGRDLHKAGFSEEMALGHERTSSLPDLLPSFFSERQYSKKYELGVQKLYSALDTLHKQQKTSKHELENDVHV